MKKNIFYFILGIILTSTVFVGAGISYKAEEISYNNEATGLSTNVQNAMNDLYDKYNTGDAIGDDLLENKSALVNGLPITGTMKDNGAWISTPTENGKISIPKGYHNGEGYVDTSVLASNPNLKSQTVSSTIYIYNSYGTITFTFDQLKEVKGITQIKTSNDDYIRGWMGVTISGNKVSFVVADGGGAQAYTTWSVTAVGV